jgi:hypothetical protein
VDLCLCNALKETGHGINVVGIEGLSQCRFLHEQATFQLEFIVLGAEAALSDSVGDHYFLDRLSGYVLHQTDIPQVLRFQAGLYFGSLGIAIIVLKKDQRLSHGWSKPKILNILSRMHRTKVGLAYAKVRREFPALVSPAERYLGRWGKALYADGIDPNLYFVHHRWRKAA